MAPPTYRERLRVEGLALAGLGTAASLALVALVPGSRRWPLNTLAQLAALVALLEAVGTRALRRWMDRAEQLEPGEEGSGEPTPVWLLPPIMAALVAVFVVLPETGLPASNRAGWDAALRITLGSALVGLAQALRYAHVVAGDESRRERRYVRMKGSHLLTGTKLGFTRT